MNISNKMIIALMACCTSILASPANASAQNQQGIPYSEDYQIVTHDGAWCWFSDPRAIYVNDKIFGGFVDKEGSIWAFSYDPATQQEAQHMMYYRLQYDDHCAPSIMTLPDKRLVMFFSKHGGSPIYYAISSRPADISEWGNLHSLTPKMEGDYGYCYSNPEMLSDEDNRIYLFFRGKDFKPTCVYTDDLENWSEPVNIVRNDPEYGAYGRPYTKVTTNHKDKIFMAFTDAHPRDRATNSIYFFMYKNGRMYKADGAMILDHLGSITPSQADKVYDAEKTFDKAWIWDIAYDKYENPVIVYARFADSDDQHSYWYARWTGEQWENTKITDAGSWFMRNNYKKEKPEYENNYSGGVYLDHENPSIVYTSRPVNDIFEIEKWTFVGGEKPWKTEAVTKDSERDNVRPFVVRGHKPGQPSVLWMYNYRYNHYTKYDCAIRIDQKAKGFSTDWNKEAVSEVADTVFRWIMKQSAKNRSYCAQDWISGVLYNGLFDWAEASGNQEYSDFLKKTFSRYYWQVGNRMYHGDDICVGQAYLDMYAKFKDPDMMIPTKARADWVIANPPAENIDITKGPSDRWWWCDALYMAPAVYTRLYSITGDKKYIKFAYNEYLACYNHLYDKDEHLFYRDGNYIGKANAKGKKIFWSRGNGWVMAGLAEILKTLPQKDRKYRPFFEQLLREMSARLASLQCSDGYWHSDLLSPELFDMPETSGTGLDTYAILYGINAGLLDEATYMPVVRKGWEAMVKAVDTEGKLCWTQTVAGAPDKVEKKNNRPYSSGAFLMTASEILKYID